MITGSLVQQNFKMKKTDCADCACPRIAPDQMVIRAVGVGVPREQRTEKQETKMKRMETSSERRPTKRESKWTEKQIWVNNSGRK